MSPQEYLTKLKKDLLIHLIILTTLMIIVSINLWSISVKLHSSYIDALKTQTITIYGGNESLLNQLDLGEANLKPDRITLKTSKVNKISNI